ncbi:dihydrodipicolinate synthase family protein [Rubritalea tangerina]|uniref:Dihydrodipicolinate synthase family protein n=1 Tax=Rubritalea tangerina TaxID=430798 RepID=A0ABW4ZDE7_9BACT
MNKNIFSGTIPALMTPCDANGVPDFAALVDTAKSLIAAGMDAVVYCGSMGDWPLLTDEERMTGVKALVDAGIKTIVGTGAQNTRIAVAHATHAREVGAHGLMVIPRVLSRTLSPAAQQNHFTAILEAGGPDLPAVIYNSPHYGFETKADLFFKLHTQYPQLIGFKEFGGAQALSYAAEHITTGNDQLTLMVGVDTQAYHGFVNCAAEGAITGVGTAMPLEVLKMVDLCKRAAQGDANARRLALELNEAMHILCTFDEGTDLVLYYKRLMVLEGNPAYQHHILKDDQLSPSQQAHLDSQHTLFRNWWNSWDGKDA